MVSKIVVALTLLCPSLHAVVISSGASNTTAPVGQPFFNNVGHVGSSSGIYLGNGWVMTANHVASSLPANATFGGTSYTTIPGSWQRLTNKPSNTFTDIVLFRLNAPPSLPTLTISNSTPTVGSPVMMIGRGNQQNTESFWNRTVGPGTNDDTWIQVPQGSHNISGFTTTATRVVRWGDNAIHQNNLVLNSGHGDVLSLTTSFDQNAFLHQAQGVSGDSGGAVFLLNGGVWELAGMMHAVATFENQPGGGNSAFYGNQTVIADLSVYRSQFVTLIPEPSTTLLTSTTLLLLLRRKR